jgi:hypothetical protein
MYMNTIQPQSSYMVNQRNQLPYHSINLEGQSEWVHGAVPS